MFRIRTGYARIQFFPDQGSVSGAVGKDNESGSKQKQTLFHGLDDSEQLSKKKLPERLFFQSYEYNTFQLLPDPIFLWLNPDPLKKMTDPKRYF